ncbi:LacI family DNA-binding transcriptional regulator [Parafilimonas terrae]|uniref:Transcriptional regulator, LacI family n=1 Tax=Parafilimonas terrae TaxID=1465490 RepID=A0A1I5TFI6_9BACT|nr:LacI family DNA-binding transcriptional regulator [Parafilimonas terrae]SFP81834.1 transcriptional regulator, LacI family [Parafilimonas terrae]
MEKKVALKDVAQHIGVSVALVSYVLNGKEKEARVGADMANKIRKAAAELNYQPNLIAKSLKMGKTKTIGLIVADISNPFFSTIARIVEDEAKKHGYVVIFGSSDESAEKQLDLIDVFSTRLVDAFIIAPASGTEKQIETIVKRGIPVVLMDRFFPGLKVDCVHINNFNAAGKAVKQLIKNNRKRIGMVAYDTMQSHMQDRKQGYKAALKENSIRFKKQWLVEASYQNIEKDVAAKLKALLKPLQVDALFFATNSLAVAGLKEINKLGIKVPDDLAIISFDESDAFDFFYSPVTYVSQSLVDIGKEAVKLILNRLHNKSKKNADVIVEARLIVRESCGSKL